MVSRQPNRLRVATIPQRPVLFEALSVRQNLSCLSRSHTLGHTFDAGRLGEIVQVLKLDIDLDKVANSTTISGGEAQRLMLGRVQLVKPDLIVLDEPCASLDNVVKDSFLRDLRLQVDRQHALALLVTHTWAEARSVADKVVFLSRHGHGAVLADSLSIEAAEATPPSIEAAFSVHWPRIFEVEKSLLNSCAHEVAFELPSTTSVGLLFESYTQLAGVGAELVTAIVDRANKSGLILPKWISESKRTTLALYDHGRRFLGLPQ